MRRTGRFFAAAGSNNLQRRVQAVEDYFKTFQQMNAAAELFELKFQSAANRLHPKVKEVLQQFPEIQDPRNRAAMRIRHQGSGVVTEVLFQSGMAKQVSHHRFGISTRL